MDHLKTKGFAAGALAAASYGLNPLFALPLYAAGMTVDSVLFYRYSFAVLMLGILMKVKGQSFAITRHEGALLLAMGLLFSASSLLLFESYNYMDAGIASTILFVYPVMVAVIMALFFHEHINMITIFSITLAVVGIGLLYKGGDGQTLSLIGVLLVIFSSLTYAVYIVWVNRSSIGRMSNLKMTFYVILFGSLIYIVRLKGLTELQMLPSFFLAADAFALALFPTIISLMMLTVSIHCIGSTPAAILGALEPVTALFFGVMVFGEQLTPRLIVGIILILFAVTLIIAGKPMMQKVMVKIQGGKVTGQRK